MPEYVLTVWQAGVIPPDGGAPIRLCEVGKDEPLAVHAEGSTRQRSCTTAPRSFPRTVSPLPGCSTWHGRSGWAPPSGRA